MATTSISQLTTAATVDNGDLLEIAHPDAGSATGYSSNKQSLAAIADHMATAVNYPTLNTTAKTTVGAINEVLQSAGGGVELTGTLAAGNTTITFNNAAIETTSTFDFYTDTFGVNPTAVSVSTGSITLTFEAQAAALGVKVRVS